MAEMEVTAFWDTESAVWIARSDNLPGLFTEADTLEDLISKLKVLIPKLVEANDRNCHGAVPFVLQVMDTVHALEEALPHKERRPHHVVHAPGLTVRGPYQRQAGKPRDRLHALPLNGVDRRVAVDLASTYRRQCGRHRKSS